MIGTYKIAIEDAGGSVVRVIEKVTRTAAPRTGEEIELDGALFVVRLVRHEANPDGKTITAYTTPTIFVRPTSRGRARR